jgi:hypothetical protein
VLSYKQILELRNLGYTIVPYMPDAAERTTFASEITAFNGQHYNQESLNNGTAYPSDSTDTRVSNAYLVSGEENGAIPSITLTEDMVNIDNLHQDWNTLLFQMAGPDCDLDTNTVSMINMQEYLGDSKEVPPHLDGLYLEMSPTVDGVFSITEALIPEFVGVLVLSNEGTSGTVLTEIDSGEKLSPTVNVGDMIIFDNVRFTHEVPTLSQKRSMIGIRNWSFSPFLFTQDRGPSKIKTNVNDFFNGYIRRISSVDAADVYLTQGGVYEEAPF